MADRIEIAEKVVAVLNLLPLFPLDLVLLPGSPLPLHIFEPRYKEMISECLEQKKPFGIVRASDEGVADIGCTAEILSVTKKYDDGRMDILARGVDRFEVLEVNEERAFLRAEISLVQDEDQDEDEVEDDNDPASRPEQSLVEQAVRLHAEIVKLAGAEPSEPDESSHQSFFPVSRFSPARSRLQAESASDSVGNQTPGSGRRISASRSPGSAASRQSPLELIGGSQSSSTRLY